MKRDGNPLGAACCAAAWDGRTLRVRTRNMPMTATEAHVAVIGHITQADLRRTTRYHRRVQWLRQSRFSYGSWLSDPRRSRSVAVCVLTTTASSGWSRRCRKQSCGSNQRVAHIDFDKRARRMWPKLYEELKVVRARRAAFGAITDRAEPRAWRLALIYAVLDKSSTVQAGSPARGSLAFGVSRRQCGVFCLRMLRRNRCKAASLAALRETRHLDAKDLHIAKGVQG